MTSPHNDHNSARKYTFLIPSISSGGSDLYPPYFDAIVAGGLAGSTGDFAMHSVDTVKTRLQGQPHHRAPKYYNMTQAYKLVWREEGIIRGLYAGVTPAMLGSIPATTIYFSIYEFTKRNLTANNVPEVISHLTAGSLGDLVASFIYVPSEVLKTRLQLQGRYNNPHFMSGYNYRNTWHAIKVIVKYDGFLALFHGFKATILRDVPYSAIQFACYEQFKKFAHKTYGSPEVPMGVDLLTGSLAGALAGAVTTPLDVMKTLLQTQQGKKNKPSTAPEVIPSSKSFSTAPQSPPGQPKHYTGILEGMVWNYKNQGLGGLFRGVGPRVFWTSLQSAIMFVVYEQILHVETHLRQKGEWPPSTAAAKHIG